MSLRLVPITCIQNVYTYINSLITLRLPQITCKDCILASIIPNVPGLNFFGCMHFHLAYVQYLMIFSLIFNRFTAVLSPLKYNAVGETILNQTRGEITDLEAVVLPIHDVQFVGALRHYLSMVYRGCFTRLYG